LPRRARRRGRGAARHPARSCVHKMRKLLLFLAACGAAPPPAPATRPAGPRPPVRLEITLLSANLDGRTPAASARDDDAAPPSPPQPGGMLAAYFAAHPGLEGTGHLIGEPVDVPGVLSAARRSSAPDGMVFVEIAGKTFRSTLAPGQFAPVWNFPLVV